MGKGGEKTIRLTFREREIADLMVKGKTSQQIADELQISRHTVDTHRRNILKKAGVKSTLELSDLLRNRSDSAT